MKMEFGPYIKSLSPATATAEIKVLELDEGERFDEETLRSAVRCIVSKHQPLYEMMEFDNHQTFHGVFNFVYGERMIQIRAYPLFTKNFRKLG